MRAEADILTELKKRVDLDQQLRKDRESSLASIQETTVANTAFIKNYLESNDFPDSDTFPVQILKQFWVIIQHSDHDVDFQEECLQRMKALVDEDKFPKSNYAFLYDRVCVARNQPQMFGTQCETVDGKSEIRRLLFSEEETNKLRVEYNVIPHLLEEYRSLMNGDDSVLDKYL